LNLMKDIKNKDDIDFKLLKPFNKFLVIKIGVKLYYTDVSSHHNLLKLAHFDLSEGRIV
jgi:hypothetical protein